MREKHGSVASHMHPDWGPNPQPRYVPWRGIKPVTFQSAGWCSNPLSHTGQDYFILFFNYNLQSVCDSTCWPSSYISVHACAQRCMNQDVKFCFICNKHWKTWRQSKCPVMGKRHETLRLWQRMAEIYRYERGRNWWYEWKNLVAECFVTGSLMCVKVMYSKDTY